MGRRKSATDQTRRTQRTVHFYKLHGGVDGQGRIQPYDTPGALALIGDLSFATGERYLAEDADTVLAAWPDGADRGIHQARFVTIRRSALPRVENNGRLTGLQLPMTAGLAEITHVCFFADSTVGILFNHYGPRPGRIADYLTAKCTPAFPVPQLDALIRSDVSAQLLRLGSVSLVDLSVRYSAANVLAEYDAGLAEAIEAAHRFAGAQRVRLVLQPEPYSREVLGPAALALIRRLVRIPGLSTLLDRFVVRGVDDQRHERVDIDVLKEYLVSAQDVVFVERRSRAIEDDSAYTAIRRAYTALQPEIASATIIGVGPRAFI